MKVSSIDDVQTFGETLVLSVIPTIHSKINRESLRQEEGVAPNLGPTLVVAAMESTECA